MTEHTEAQLVEVTTLQVFNDVANGKIKPHRAYAEMCKRMSDSQALIQAQVLRDMLKSLPGRYAGMYPYWQHDWIQAYAKEHGIDLTQGEE